VSKGGRLNARVTRLELASRVRTVTLFSEECLCFPVDEQPEFRWQAEAETAAKVLCPLHGRRFQTIVTRFLYRALHYYVADFEQGWPDRSAQYWLASHPPSWLHMLDLIRKIFVFVLPFVLGLAL
jgi:hypothetical protein